LVSPPEPLPKDPPTAKPERRVKLNQTPEALFAALTSKDEPRMTEAATALGWEWLAHRIYGAVSLHAVNLDADDATERILTLENAAAVLKQEGADWTNYQVYRLLRGHLYLVFEIDENPYNWRETIDTRVLPLSPGKLATLRTRGKATTCTNWNWNPAKYLFEHTSPKPAKCPQ
jgi:hypothetical protein